MSFFGENRVFHKVYRNYKLARHLRKITDDRTFKIRYVDQCGVVPNACAMIEGGIKLIVVGRDFYEAVSEPELLFALAHEYMHHQLGQVEESTVVDDLDAVIQKEIEENRPTGGWPLMKVKIRDFLLRPLQKISYKKALQQNRENEFKADVEAVRLLTAKGLDHSGAVVFLKRMMRNEYPIGACNIYEEESCRAQATHPFAYERLRRVEEALAEVNWHTT